SHCLALFFFQAEDGIRDATVTGVQTCALPISGRLLVTLATYNEHDNLKPLVEAIHEQAPHADILVIDDNSPDGTGRLADEIAAEIGRASCRERENTPERSAA